VWRWNAGTSKEIIMAILHLASHALLFRVALAEATLMQAMKTAMDEITHACTALHRDMLRLCHTPPTAISVAHGLESTPVGMLGEICVPSILIEASSPGTGSLRHGGMHLCRDILLYLLTPQLLQGESAICITGKTNVVGWEAHGECD